MGVSTTAYTLLTWGGSAGRPSVATDQRQIGSGARVAVDVCGVCFVGVADDDILRV